MVVNRNSPRQASEGGCGEKDSLGDGHNLQQWLSEYTALQWKESGRTGV